MRYNLGREPSIEEDRVQVETKVEDDITRASISSIDAREKEIEVRMREVRMRVEDRLDCAEEETRRLSLIWEELEEFADPLRKEVATMRKKIGSVLRELKPLCQSFQKREKDYKEAFNETSKERELVSALMQLLSESEQLRMRKLGELTMKI